MKSFPLKIRKQPSGECFWIHVEPKYRISTCQQKIERKRGIPLSNIRLGISAEGEEQCSLRFKSGDAFQQQTLESLGLVASIQDVDFNTGPCLELSPITLHVRTPTGKRIVLKDVVDVEATVDRIEELVNDRLESVNLLCDSEERFRLYHNRIPLRRGNPITDYKIQNLDELKLQYGTDSVEEEDNLVEHDEVMCSWKVLRKASDHEAADDSKRERRKIRRNASYSPTRGGAAANLPPRPDHEAADNSKRERRKIRRNASYSPTRGGAAANLPPRSPTKTKKKPTRTKSWSPTRSGVPSSSPAGGDPKLRRKLKKRSSSDPKASSERRTRSRSRSKRKERKTEPTNGEEETPDKRRSRSITKKKSNGRKSRSKSRSKSEHRDKSRSKSRSKRKGRKSRSKSRSKSKSRKKSRSKSRSKKKNKEEGSSRSHRSSSKHGSEDGGRKVRKRRPKETVPDFWLGMQKKKGSTHSSPRSVETLSTAVSTANVLEECSELVSDIYNRQIGISVESRHGSTKVMEVLGDSSMSRDDCLLFDIDSGSFSDADFSSEFDVPLDKSSKGEEASNGEFDEAVYIGTKDEFDVSKDEYDVSNDDFDDEFGVEPGINGKEELERNEAIPKEIVIDANATDEDIIESVPTSIAPIAQKSKKVVSKDKTKSNREDPNTPRKKNKKYSLNSLFHK